MCPPGEQGHLQRDEEHEAAGHCVWLEPFFGARNPADDSRESAHDVAQNREFVEPVRAEQPDDGEHATGEQESCQGDGQRFAGRDPTGGRPEEQHAQQEARQLAQAEPDIERGVRADGGHSEQHPRRPFSGVRGTMCPVVRRAESHMMGTTRSAGNRPAVGRGRAGAIATTSGNSEATTIVAERRRKWLNVRAS